MEYFCGRFLFLMSSILLISGCSPFRSKSQSIIVILVESFSEQDYLCSQPRLIEDLEHLSSVCNEFQRFTHVFAPSTLTKPSLSSLLTGKPIKTHKVFHNGPLAISNHFQTLAEQALSQKMRTALFSGGVPLLGNFGLRQGYEFFNDSFSESQNHFRPFDKTIDSINNWMTTKVGNQSFFLTAYVPDLLYKKKITITDDGRERPSIYQSQLLEFYESMNTWIGDLKKQNLWDSTHIVLLGLRGNITDLEDMDRIHSSSLHVPMQIKLAKGVESNLERFKSRLLSFHHVGRWLEKLLFYRASQGSLLFSDEEGDAIIPLRSDWGAWKKIRKKPILGLRIKQYLFRFDPKLWVFDSYDDDKEIQPMSYEEGLAVARKEGVLKKIKNYFEDPCLYFRSGETSPALVFDCDIQNIKAKSYNTQDLPTSLSLLHKRFDDGAIFLKEVMGTDLPQKSYGLRSWLIRFSMENAQWSELLRLGEIQSDKAIELVAQKNLKKEVAGKRKKNCERYFIKVDQPIDDFYKNCQDIGLRKVVQGLSRLRKGQKPSGGFWETVSSIKKSGIAKKINLEMHFSNDVLNSFDFTPSLAEMYFYLPENSEYKKLIKINKG